MSTIAPDSLAKISRLLVLSVAVLFLTCALLFNEYLIELVIPPEKLTLGRIESVRQSQLWFLAAAFMFFAASKLVRRVGWIRRLAGHTATPRLLLVLASVVVPIAILELLLKPWVEIDPRETTIYMRDADLMWKHRPHARDRWEGVTV